jgi:hypothetical protein
MSCEELAAMLPRPRCVPLLLILVRVIETSLIKITTGKLLVTKNRYWYRHQFEKLFPQDACTESVARWIPRADWGCPSDPSGRAQKVHAATYNATSYVEALNLIDKKKGTAVA